MNGVYYIDDLFTQKDLDFLIKFIDSFKLSQQIIENKEISDFIFSRCKNAIQNIDPTISHPLGQVTITKRSSPIGKHVDLCLNQGDRYKIGLYLNDVQSGGGTIFYINDTKHLIQHKKGRLVMFDLKIPHEGESSNKELKYMIGIRVK